MRRADQRPLHNPRNTFILKKRGHRLARADFADRLRRVKARVGAIGLRRHRQVFLVLRRERMQRVLHPVAQLPQNDLRHIRRVLRDEVNPHTFRPDQPRHLFDLGNQGLGRVGEQQMRLVEKEHQLRLVRIAHLRQLFEQLRQQPQQECRVQLRRQHQLFRRQHVDHPRARGIHPHQVRQIQRRLAKQLHRPLIFQDQQLALDRRNRCRRHQPIAFGNIRRILGNKHQQRLKILEVKDRQLFLIRQPEGDVQNPLLRVVQVQYPRQQQRAHFRHRRPDRMAVLAKDIPERHRKCPVDQVIFDRRRPLDESILQLLRRGAGPRDARQVALHIRHEHRHARRREVFRQHLQGHRLARARRPRDQPMPVAVFQHQTLRQRIAFATAAHENRIRHHVSLSAHPAFRGVSLRSPPKIHF